MSDRAYRWTQDLNRYHWFVFVVAALGWLFDTMDQQLFNLARYPAMVELLGRGPAAVSPGDVQYYGGLATSIFLIGWATGGLVFGVIGDRFGRAKTMMLTILVYSLCTGLSAFSVGFWDFAFYRFLTGLGVGGEFAVGVALVAEVMPDRARPYALGLLQALSTVGNLAAAIISLGMGTLEHQGVIGSLSLGGFQLTAWRAMFIVGTLPALLVLLVRRRLKEPETWQAQVSSAKSKSEMGSYGELFGDPVLRHRAIVGVLLATSGVIGLWGIGFFSIDLNRVVFRKKFEAEARAAGQAAWDRDVLRSVLDDPGLLSGPLASLQASQLLGEPSAPQLPAAILNAMRKKRDPQEPLTTEWIAATVRHDAAGQGLADGVADYLSGSAASDNAAGLVASIQHRAKAIDGKLTQWASITSMLLNVGGFFGIYGFSVLAQRIGRRPTFALAFLAAGLSTALVFWYMQSIRDIFWMIPLMGFCQLSIFGGFAVYFPELFPTRLRSTGISFCYNVGRFVAALGPFVLGLLTSQVFAGYPEPMRYAGVAMCLIFAVGVLILPFAPETKGQPLPT